MKRHPQQPRVPKVLLLVETTDGYGRGILEGIGRYIREHGPWSIFFEERSLLDPLPRWLGRWQGDGIISRTASLAAERRLQSKRLPMVELLGLQAEGPAKVHGENVSAGCMAAEHLLGCGLRNFGFFSIGEAWWIETYREGFVRALADRGYACHVYKPPRMNRRLLPRWVDAQRPGVTAWLESLPRPAGILSPQLGDSRVVIDICRGLGVSIPEEVAVLGAADDPSLCSVTTPPLSAIDFDSSRIGYEAAAMLDRMMAGAKPPRDVLWIPPVRVVARQSTDVLAIGDRDLAQAIRFVRQHALRGIDVTQVAQAVGLSRRVLERRFRQHFGCTPKREIRRVQIDHAKLLLGQTEISIEAVARGCGFRAFKHFARVFRRETGVTPRAFRMNVMATGI